jgi:hypothetical protein
MALDVELVIDGSVTRKEPLRRAWRPKASTLVFLLSGWLVRGLGPIVRPHAGDMAIGQTEIA